MILVSLDTGVRQQLEFNKEFVTVGRAPDNDIVLTDPRVSARHFRIVRAATRNFIEDLRSMHGTVVLVDGKRERVYDGGAKMVEFDTRCEVHLGSDAQPIVFEITIPELPEANVVSIQPLESIGTKPQGFERDAQTLQRLYSAQQRLDSASELDDVLRFIGDGVLELLPRATHVTITLRQDDENTQNPAYESVLTRVRGDDGVGRAPSGAVPIARTVFRKVIKQRAAVLAEDAPQDVGQAESILGASIRSTAAVPLVRGDTILGVIQADNRNAPGMLNVTDLKVLTMFATNASLAVANARLIQRLRAAQQRLRKQNDFLRTREETRSHGQTILGESAAMQKVLEQLGKVVDTRVTVLVQGETGTGKELLAAALHYRSSRRNNLFVAQNCAALPENLLESELFGHKRGAFTGATEDKKGMFDIADGGTLFLDEVGEMPLSLQSKLLRVLQDGEIRPVGAARPHQVDVRIVAATNRDLHNEVKEGRFREDLFYRLNVFPLVAPPLRERREDIAILAGTFLKRYASELGKTVSGFSQQAMEMLVAYAWPGNVRELQNEVQRLVIQVDDGGFVVPELLSPHIRRVEGLLEKAGVTKGSLRQMVDQVEKYLLIEALREHDNNKTSTAKTLGITREGLHKKLRSHGL